MTIDESIRLAVLQQRVFRCIEDELESDNCHKSYEGAMDVTLSLPNIFVRDDKPKWHISLHCYVINMNGRHHNWTGDTLSEALAKAEHDLGKVCGEYEFKRFSNRLECVDEPGEATGDIEIHGDCRNGHEAGELPW